MATSPCEPQGKRLLQQVFLQPVAVSRRLGCGSLSDVFRCYVTLQDHAARLTAAHLDMTHVWKGLTFRQNVQD